MNIASARRIASRTAALGSIGLLVVLSGCAASAGSPAPRSTDAAYSLGSQHPTPPEADVIAIGTVIDEGGAAKLCLGTVMESYPPQCVGVPLAGWTWDGAKPDDESGSTRWGTYGMSGTYDGTTFAPANPPVSLALFDPISRPEQTSGVPGAAAEQGLDLATIQETIADLLGPDVQLSSAAEDGYLIVDVVWDDGTLQEAADADFGPGVVVIRSALWLTE